MDIYGQTRNKFHTRSGKAPWTGWIAEMNSTVLYPNNRGTAMAAVTTMKDMPHGAIHDESCAVWNFLKQFRRTAGAKNIDRLIIGQGSHI